MRSRMRLLVSLSVIAPAAWAAGKDIAIASREAFEAHFPTARFWERESGRIGRVYGAAMGQGVTAELSAEGFRDSFASMFGAEAADLVPGNHFNDDLTLSLMPDYETGEMKFTMVYYRHEIDGIPVFRSELRVMVRNEPGYPVVWVANAIQPAGVRDVINFAAPELRLDLAQSRVTETLPEAVNFSEPREVIFAGVEDISVTPRLAIEFIADAGTPPPGEAPQKRLFVCDAVSGAVLYEENLVLHSNITGNVGGLATTGSQADACAAEVSTPMRWARVSRGASFVYADANGNFNIDDGGSSPVTLTSEVRGQWFRVYAGGTTFSLSQSASAPGPSNFTHNAANNNETRRAEVNAYVQANVVRDYTLQYAPTYPTIGTQAEFRANVMVSGTCNAFYDGASINFYPAGGGCNNTAFATVVHHEYGHHLVAVAGSGQGAYGEGMGDVMGVLITDESALGIGFQTCGVGIRNANNSCQYQVSGCSSCGSAIHACGQLISGCVWSTRTNLLATNPGTYRDIISALAINAMPMHTGTTIASDITIDYLTLDDDNGNLCDGTPHFSEIYNGFAAHSMVTGVATPNPIKIEFPNGVPSLIDPAGQPIQFRAVGVTGTPQTNTGKLYYRIGTAGAYTSVNATQLSPNLYEANLPSAVCGSLVQFYCSARDTLNVEYTSPCTNPTTSPYQAFSGYGVSTVFHDDFETNLGWSAGVAGDTATTGQWNRMNPEGTAAQPEDDVTPGSGVNCYVTNGFAGGSLGANDVDNGFTTLRSPVINLAGAGNARVSYWRWYSNNTGGAPNADTFRVDITNNGTTWVNAETVGPAGAGTSGGWIYHEFMVASFVAPSATVQVRFIAEDAGDGSLVEAAVDEFRVEVVDCVAPPSCDPCDANCDGSVNPFDINEFLTIISGASACSPCAGDTDGNGTTNPFDIQPFLDCLSS